jgi:hypothetical protein
MAEPGYLRDVADGFERLASEEVKAEPAYDEYEGDVRVARFARFSIILPPSG